MPGRPRQDTVAELGRLYLVVGDEELLVARAIGQISAAARAADSATDVVERAGGQLEGAELAELLGPSLFGERRVLVIRSAQDLHSAATAALVPYLRDPVDGATVVLQHVGGAKGKAVLDLARGAGAEQIICNRLTRPEERYDFARREIRAAGGRIAADAVAPLVDAVGSDLRELAAAAGQLVSDSGGTIDLATVRAFHRGRADVSGFSVSDRAVEGRLAEAIETLRWALSIGVPHVVIADALADGVRTVARVAAAGPGDAYRMAPALGMPAWKVRNAQRQARGWDEPGLRAALRVVAVLNADVKGEAVDASWALEHAVRRISGARQARR